LLVVLLFNLVENVFLDETLKLFPHFFLELLLTLQISDILHKLGDLILRIPKLFFYLDLGLHDALDLFVFLINLVSVLFLYLLHFFLELLNLVLHFCGA